MSDQMTFDFRTDDPWTSRQGAEDVAIRKGSQQAILLRTYAAQSHWDGLTDEEAGERSGLARLPRCCYWKRCSELRRMGLIEDAGTSRPSSAGSPQRVFRISMFGMDKARGL